MEIHNILGSLVNNSQGNIPNQNRVFPFKLTVMEQKVKLYPSDNFKNEFYCNIAAWCHLESKKEGKQNVGWYRIRLNNSFVRFQAIHIRAIEVIEDNNYDTWFFKNRKFIRYEVKPNPWHIEFLEFRRGEGFFAIGKRLDLLRTPPLYEMVNI